MKQCPQCDFIYENDQTLCDMDGWELVYTPTKTLKLPENAAILPPVPPAKSQPRRFVPLPVAGAILAATLFPAYYVFTRRPATPNVTHTLAEVAAAPQPAPDPVPPPPVALTTPPPSAKLLSAKVPITQVKMTSGVPPAVRRSPTSTPPPAPQQGEKKPKPEEASRKKESKLGSILKKTGKILKKPFGF